jgi:hypothetical protein
MVENLSPEERLFKVIQEGKQEKPKERPEKQIGKNVDEWMRGMKRFILSIGARRPAPAGKGFDWKKMIPRPVKLNELKPDLINKALAGVLVMVVALVVYSAFSERQDMAKVTGAISRLQKSPLTAGGEKIEPFESLDFYLNEIRKRDIFRPIPKSMMLEPKVALQESLRKSAENLKLQGISWGDRPTAMILWQTDKESKMYFLIKGQSIGSTGIKVKAIYKNRVTIEREDSEMDLL